MACLVERNKDNKVTAVYSSERPEESKRAGLKYTLNQFLVRLKNTGLASDVVMASTSWITEIHGIEYANVKGFVKGGVVYINEDTYTLDTPIHEFGHLWINWVKNRNYGLYKRGMALIEKEGQIYIDKVLETQPNLKGRQLLEEALAEAIGDSGAELIVKDSNKETPFSAWLNDMWSAIKKLLGISDTENIETLSLKDFTERVAVDLMKGVDKSEYTQPYTIQPLMDKMLEKMKGRFVSVQTIKQILKQPQTKKIEKEIIEEVLELEQFKGKNKIDFNDFEFEVNERIFPLTVIVSDSYADYGSEVTNTRFDNKETHIYNTEFEHGYTGHFSGDFPAPPINLQEPIPIKRIEVKVLKPTKTPEEVKEMRREQFLIEEKRQKVRNNREWDALTKRYDDIQRELSLDQIYDENQYAEITVYDVEDGANEVLKSDRYNLDDVSTPFSSMNGQMQDFHYNNKNGDVFTFYTYKIPAQNAPRSFYTATAPTPERAINYVKRVEGLGSDTRNYDIRELQGKFAVVRSGVQLTQENLPENVLTVTETRAAAEKYMEELVYKEFHRKGLFGHSRVWQDGTAAYVGEIQSDYFQKKDVMQFMFDYYKEHPEELTPSGKKIFQEYLDVQDVLDNTSVKTKDIYRKMSRLYEKISKFKETLAENEARLQAINELGEITDERIDQLFKERMDSFEAVRDFYERQGQIDLYSYGNSDTKQRYYEDLDPELKQELDGLLAANKKAIELYENVKLAKSNKPNVEKNIEVAKADIKLAQDIIDLYSMYAGLKEFNLTEDDFTLESQTIMEDEQPPSNFRAKFTYKDSIKRLSFVINGESNSVAFWNDITLTETFIPIEVTSMEETKRKAIEVINEKLKEMVSVPKKEYTDYFKALQNVPKVNKKFLESLPLRAKQFIAHRKNYVQRILREEIRRQASLGMDTLLIPTPRTLALIEGYISGGEDGGMPYRILEAGDDTYLETGDTIEYLGEEYTVLRSDGTTIEIVENQSIGIYSIDQYKEGELDWLVDSEMDNLPFSDGDIITEDEVQENNYIVALTLENVAEYDEELDGYVYDSNKAYDAIREYYDDNFDIYEHIRDFDYDADFEIVGDILYITHERVENLMQPDEYEAVDEEDFDIDDMGETEQTILRKYENLIEYFKTIREDVEQVQDLAGNNWLQTTLTAADRNDSVVVFQKQRPESMLFRELAQNPLMDTEQALEAYKNTFSNSFKSRFGDWQGLEVDPTNTVTNESGEPRLFYKSTNGLVTTSYEAALNDTNNGDVQVGFVSASDVMVADTMDMFEVANNDFVAYNGQYKLNNPEAFISVAAIDSNSEPSTLNGFINSSIRKGHLSDTKVKVGDDFFFKGKGNLESLSVFNSRLVQQSAIENLGLESVKVYPDGTLELNEVDNTKVELSSAEGTIFMDKETLKKELKNGKFNYYNNKYDGFVEVVYDLFRQDNELYKETENRVETQEKQKDLRMLVLDTLNKLGIKVTAISNYLENYNVRNGIDPSVEALADIANAIIAYSEGKISVETLTEELSHFIIEGFQDQASLEEILPQVEGTKQWKQYAQRYYNKYGQIYSGAELDNIVRREVLAKILRDKIVDGFNNQNTNSSEQSIIEYLRQKFNEFLARVRSYLTPTIKKDLDTVLDDIANKVLNEEIQDFIDKDLLKESKFTLFSLNDKRALVTIQKARQQFERRLMTLKQSRDVTAPQVQQAINKLAESIANADEWHGIKTIVSAVDPQVKSIRRQLDRYADLNEKDEDKTAYFTPEEQSAFRSLSEDFLPILEELRVIVDKELQPMEGINKEVVLNQIDTLIKEISLLKGEVDVQIAKDNNAIINRILDEYGLTDQEREALEALIARDLADVSWFQRNFGSLEHSSNVFLGLLGKIIANNNNKANRRLLKDMNPFLKTVDEDGWRLEEWRDILESKDGHGSNFTKSPYAWGRFIEAELEAQKNAYNQIFGTNLTTEQFIEYRRGGSGLYSNSQKLKRISDFTPEEAVKYREIMDEWYKENTERRYTDEFYEEREKAYEGIGQETKEFLKNLSVRRYSILAPYMAKLGEGESLDYTTISPRDRQQLFFLTQERKAAKSLIDSETGLQKTGSELQLAEDLQKLDEYYQENKKNFKVKDDFLDNLRRVEAEQGSEAAFDWLRINGGIIFNDKFWDGFSQDRVSLMDKLSTIAEEMEGENAEDYDKVKDMQESLETLLKRKTEILKQYQVPNNPSEIDYDNMSGQVIQNLKDIETELQKMFLDLNVILSRYDEEEVGENVIFTENTTNESYEKALKDSNKSELEFILDHVTDTDKSNISEVKRRLDKVKAGSDFIDMRTKRFLANFMEENGYESMEMVDFIRSSDTEQLAVEYGKTRVLPYFKRFAPLGYDAYLNSLKSGELSVADSVQRMMEREQTGEDNTIGIEQLLNVNTQFSWTEDEAGSRMLNPNYDENFKGGMRQPKMDKYLNDEFFDEFGINKAQYRATKELVATKNLDKFAMLEKLWELKEKGLEAYNELGTENVYKIPQASKGTVERTIDFASKNPIKTVGNSIKDIIFNRVDDLGYGERMDGQDIRDISDIRLVPKYYLRDLEETSDVSNELAHSYALFLQAAYTYQERMNTVSDVMVLEQKMLKQDFEGGKSAESTRAYDMFKNFMDAYFFGIKRSRKFTIPLPNGKELDISKLAIIFDRFVRYVNIGFSLPIAATSLVTAEIFLRIENHIGEHVNTNSAKWASKEFAKLSPEFFSEIGAINKESKMNLLAERFRVFGLTERTTSSGFNKIIRASNNLPYKFTEIANYPIAPRIMLTVLDDFRLINGKFIDFNAYKKTTEAQGLTKKELEAKWNEYRESSMYNLMEVRDGNIEFKQEAVDLVGLEYLEEQLSRVQGRISRVNANVDSVVPSEDKSAATRDFLMNFMTAHRGWLSIAIQRKFKRKHFNFNTGQVEEGHYRTLARFLKQGFFLGEEKNMKNFVKTFKENYEQLEDFEKRNIKRTMVELGVYSFLLTFGILVAALADDDDNKDLWALQFGSYIYFRTVSEVGSVQAPTGVFGLVDIVQAPFVAINSVKEMMDVKGWSLEEVESGTYKGHSKLYRKLAKQTWLRHLYDLQGIKKKSDYYRLLNSETLFHLAR